MWWASVLPCTQSRGEFGEVGSKASHAPRTSMIPRNGRCRKVRVTSGRWRLPGQVSETDFFRPLSVLRFSRVLHPVIASREESAGRKPDRPALFRDAGSGRIHE